MPGKTFALLTTCQPSTTSTGLRPAGGGDEKATPRGGFFVAYTAFTPSAPVGFEDVVRGVGLAGEACVQTAETWLQVFRTGNPCSFLIHQVKTCILTISCAEDDGILI